MIRRACVLAAGVALASWGMPPSALAQAPPPDTQATRAATIAAEQATKATQLEPYRLSKPEQIAANMKRRLFESPDGFYPWLDSVYSGGGLTLGAGYRSFYGDQTFWTIRGLFSVKAYKLVEGGTESIGLAHGRVTLRALGGWRDATQVSYYGLGIDSTQDAQSNFQLQQAYAGVSAAAHGPKPLVATAMFRYEDFTIDQGHGSSPSIDERYTADTAPGLGANPTSV
jgi:hypothetical protein